MTTTSTIDSGSRKIRVTNEPPFLGGAPPASGGMPWG